MIELAMVVCLLAEPTKCKDVTLTFMSPQESVTPQQCMSYGQPEMAKWTESHPGWMITRWKCGEARKRIEA